MIRKLGRKKSNKEHLIRNLATSLVLYETIDTTEAKGKEVKKYLETLIARNKENDLSNKRNVFANLFDNNASKKMINELFPRYKERKSGFIRSFHIQNRLGDNATMMRLEMVDKKVFVSPEKPLKSTVNKDSKENDKREVKKENIKA